LVAVLTTGPFATTSHAQILRLSADELESRVERRAPPQYPLIAQNAKIEGTVFLRVLVNPSGRVQAVIISSSANPLLNDAAIEAVRQWEFRPVTGASGPIPAIGDVRVGFYLSDPGPAASADFDRRLGECRQSLDSGNLERAEALCSALASAAGKFADTRRRADAYALAGRMLIARGRAKDALAAVRAEIELRGRATGIQLARAHRQSAVAHGMLQEARAAQRSYGQAEAMLRQCESASTAKGPTPDATMLRQTVGIECLEEQLPLLSEFADFLQRIGDTSEAAKVESRLVDVKARLSRIYESI
jgi:TonB family protein